MSDATQIASHRPEAAVAAMPVEAGGAGDYFALLKPRVMSLVVFTSIVGMVSAPGDIHWILGLLAILCIAIGAGASGALNMWFEADLDSRMTRTQGRPIPSGRLAPGDALALGASLSAGSVVVLGLFVNLASALLLAGTIAFYVLIYTMWLKRRTPQNIVIGGASGALPPVIGWAAVTGGVSLEPIILFAIIFMWTPPHFWALSLFRQEDYRRAGVPMLPIVAGEAETRKQILIYSVLLAPLALLPVGLGMAGWVYGSIAAATGVIFVWFAYRLWRDMTEKAARSLFSFSILYLFLLFASLLVEKSVWG